MSGFRPDYNSVVQVISFKMTGPVVGSSKQNQAPAKRGLTKQRKERSFRERKIFIRKEHFITLLPVLSNFKCLSIH